MMPEVWRGLFDAEQLANHQSSNLAQQPPQPKRFHRLGPAFSRLKPRSGRGPAGPGAQPSAGVAFATK